MNLKPLQAALLIWIVAASLYSSLRNLLSTRELGGLHEDPVAAWESRFQPLKERLPFVRGVVGYISDAEVPAAQYDPRDVLGEYILTQYAMAPIVLVKGSDQEWNIGNLSPQAYQVWSRAHQGQFEVFPFKGNLYLFRRLSP